MDVLEPDETTLDLAERNFGLRVGELSTGQHPLSRRVLRAQEEQSSGHCSASTAGTAVTTGTTGSYGAVVALRAPEDSWERLRLLCEEDRKSIGTGQGPVLLLEARAVIVDALSSCCFRSCIYK